MNEELKNITDLMLDELEKSNKNLRYGIWFKDFALHSLDGDVAVFSTPSNLRQKILSYGQKIIYQFGLQALNLKHSKLMICMRDWIICNFKNTIVCSMLH